MAQCSVWAVISAFSDCRRAGKKAVMGVLGYNIFGFTNALFIEGKMKLRMTTWDECASVMGMYYVLLCRSFSQIVGCKSIFSYPIVKSFRR